MSEDINRLDPEGETYKRIQIDPRTRNAFRKIKEALTEYENLCIVIRDEVLLEQEIKEK